MSNDSSSELVVSDAERAQRWPAWFVAAMALVATVSLFYFAEFAGSLIVGLGAAFFLFHTNASLGDTVVQFAYGLLADGILLIGIGLLLRWLGWNWQTIGFVRPQMWQIILGILAAVPYFIVYLVLAGLVKAFVPSLNFDQKQEIGFDNVQGILPIVLTFISLVVLPPIAEETVMRGFLFTGLRRWLPWGVAGLVVSLLFGAAHLAEGGASGPLWIGAIDTFTLSLFLVTLRQKTGSLWPSIALHATKNLIAFVFLFVIGR